MAGRKTNREERFWSKVHPEPMSGCWLWDGFIVSDGYGIFRYAKGEVYRAHRLAYILSRGPIPEYMVVRHKCNNRACVNPDHLVLGTHADNSADMVRARRYKVAAKITEQQVFEIRKRAKSGEPYVVLAVEFKIGPAAVSRIVRRQTWKHV